MNHNQSTLQQINIAIILILASIFSNIPGNSCTIVYFQKNGLALAGANEDYTDPNTMFWIYPPTDEKHGWIKFGFAGGFPQAGMNDQGIFWDGTSNPWLGMPLSEANKTKLQGPIMQKIIEECSNMDEVRDVLDSYYCKDQYKAQYLIGSFEGVSLIVEGDNTIFNDTSFQILTNFYQSHPELGGYPCGRYSTAYDEFSQCDSIDLTLIGKVLSLTCQDGGYPTQYSVIYDLRELEIYIFYYHNYEEFLNIKLLDEFQKGAHSYKIEPIFSNIGMISPGYGSSIEGTSVSFEWEGKESSGYKIEYSTDQDFNHSKSIFKQGFNKFDQPKLAFIFLFFLFIISKSGISEKSIKTILLLGVFTVLSGISCSKEEIEIIEEPKTIHFSQPTEGLQPNTCYYWRVIATPEGDTGFETESVPYKFNTGE